MEAVMDTKYGQDIVKGVETVGKRRNNYLKAHQTRKSTLLLESAKYKYSIVNRN